MGTINKYQVDTMIRLVGNFYNTVTNALADPTNVYLFIEDPTGTVTQVPSGIIRDSVGVYHYDYLPAVPGTYNYKWQGTGAVIATAPDTSFIVKTSAFLSELVIP